VKRAKSEKRSKQNSGKDNGINRRDFMKKVGIGVLSTAAYSVLSMSHFGCSDNVTGDDYNGGGYYGGYYPYGDYYYY